MVLSNKIINHLIEPRHWHLYGIWRYLTHCCNGICFSLFVYSRSLFLEINIRYNISLTPKENFVNTSIRINIQNAIGYGQTKNLTFTFRSTQISGWLHRFCNRAESLDLLIKFVLYKVNENLHSNSNTTQK